MSLTKLDIDRFITTLRTNSKEYNSITNIQLASMLEETIAKLKAQGTSLGQMGAGAAAVPQLG